MGHRANFVVIRDGHARAYYDQWAAMGCVYSFASGPEEACAALSDCEPTEELMDWAFAEGGYLIDFDEKKAIVFGYPADSDAFADLDGDSGEQLHELNSAIERGGLAFLQHVGPQWAGWKLVWDDHGVDAFAAHLKRRGITNLVVQPDSHPPDTATGIEYQA